LRTATQIRAPPVHLPRRSLAKPCPSWGETGIDHQGALPRSARFLRASLTDEDEAQEERHVGSFGKLLGSVAEKRFGALEISSRATLVEITGELHPRARIVWQELGSPFLRPDGGLQIAERKESEGHLRVLPGELPGRRSARCAREYEDREEKRGPEGDPLPCSCSQPLANGRNSESGEENELRHRGQSIARGHEEEEGG